MKSRLFADSSDTGGYGTAGGVSAGVGLTCLGMRLSRQKERVGYMNHGGSQFGVRAALLAGVLLLAIGGLVSAQEMSSANYKISTHSFNGGASFVGDSGNGINNATCDSANFRSLHQASFSVISDGPDINMAGPPASANFRNSRGFLFTIWGLGTRDTVWIGGGAPPLETNTGWSTASDPNAAFNWGYGVPIAARHARVSPALAGPQFSVGDQIGGKECNSFTVDANTTAQIMNSAIFEPADSVTLSGTLTCNTASRLYLSNNMSLTVNSGGRLNVAGTAGESNRAIIKSDVGGSYWAFPVSGQLDINYGELNGMNANGLNIQTGANIIQLQNCRFTSTITGGTARCMTLPNGNFSGATAYFGCEFVDNTAWPAADIFNVYSLADASAPDHPIVTFSAWLGGIGGEDFDRDPYHRVNWGASGAVIRIVGGSDVGTYASIEEAFANVSAASTTIQIRDNIVRTEDLTFPAYNDVILERGIIDGTVIGNAGATGETLRNCVILGGNSVGGGDDTTALGYVYNCTVVEGNIRAYAAGGVVRNCIIADTNALGDKTISAGTQSNNLGDGAVYSQTNFVDAANTDYHLFATTNTAAVAPASVTVAVSSTFGFASPAGTAYLAGTDDFNYTGKTATSFTGVTNITGNHNAGTPVTRGISTAIDGGTAIAGWSGPTDYEQNPRPLGSAWDIGADEYGEVINNVSCAMPRWTYPASGTVSHISAAHYYSFGLPAVYIGERIAADNARIVVLDPSTGAELRSLSVGNGVDRIIGFTSNWISIGSSTYRMLAVVDTNDDGYGDSILAFRDAGTQVSLVLDTDWTAQQNPRKLQIGTSIDNERAAWMLNPTESGSPVIYCVCREGDTGRLYKLNGGTGVPFNGGGWQSNPAPDGGTYGYSTGSQSFDEVAMPVGWPADYILVGLTGDGT
ncbi:MAG: hypothetical protein RDV41_07930, partial [Planctomycetota bacterium]|nr:hypothetical protein [Planctomycetota bacterium]